MKGIFDWNRRKFLKTIFSRGFLFFAWLFHPSGFFRKLRWTENLPGRVKAGNRSIKGLKTPEARVIITRDNSLIHPSTGKIGRVLLKKMISRGIMELTGQNKVSSSWRKLFSHDDIVGIKVNCLGGRMIATHPELVMILVEGLRWAGIPEEHIIIWDRLGDELREAGFQINLRSPGVRCFGTDVVGYDSQPEMIGSIGSCFSKIISTYCTALINVPVLKDHDLAGVSLGMKNFFGAIHNPNKYHDSNCDPYIADLNSHPYIKDKLRLIVLDGITAQYNGGPAYNPRWNWNYDGILISQDPVALDQIGREIIEEKRKRMGLLSLNELKREPKYIATAARLHLGEDNMEKIEVVKI